MTCSCSLVSPSFSPCPRDGGVLPPPPPPRRVRPGADADNGWWAGAGAPRADCSGRAARFAAKCGQTAASSGARTRATRGARARAAAGREEYGTRLERIIRRGPVSEHTSSARKRRRRAPAASSGGPPFPGCLTRTPSSEGGNLCRATPCSLRRHARYTRTTSTTTAYNREARACSVRPFDALAAGRLLSPCLCARVLRRQALRATAPQLTPEQQAQQDE